MNEHRFALLLAAESERALTAEERLEQMTRERDEARAQLAVLAEHGDRRERDETLAKMREALRAAERRELEALAELDEARAQLAAELKEKP